MEREEQFRLFLKRYKAQKESTREMQILLSRGMVSSIGEFTKENIDNYIFSLIDRKLQKSTIQQRITLIRFWGKCFNLKKAEHYKYEGKIRQKQYDRAVMSDDEVRAFLDLSNPFKFGCVYWRRYEMWTIFWYITAYHASRPGETVMLRKFPKDDEGERAYPDFGLNTITFDQKTGIRKVPMSPIVRDRLQEYISKLGGEWLFPPLHESKLPYMGCESWGNDFDNRLKRIEDRFPNITKRANIDPYSVRTSGATRWARRGINMKTIQKLMGHKKITTTEKYVQMVMEDEREALEIDPLGEEFFTPEKCIIIARDENEKLEKRLNKQLEVSYEIGKDRLMVEFKIKKELT